MASAVNLMGLGVPAGVATLLGENASGVMNFNSTQTILSADTADGSDNKSFNIAGGGNNAAFATPNTRGAYITLEGNEVASGGRLILGAGGVATSVINFAVGGTTYYTITNAGTLQSVAAGNETTGAQSALLGANCPATTFSAPYKWVKFLTSDASVCYIPVWK